MQDSIFIYEINPIQEAEWQIKKRGVWIYAFQTSCATHLLFVHFFSISSIPLPAKCPRCSGQIFRCPKGRARHHWACITLFCFKDKVDLMHLWCRFTARIADPFCAINPVFPVHIRLSMHTNTFCLWLPRKEKHCFWKVKWWLVYQSEKQIIICSCQTYR